MRRENFSHVRTVYNTQTPCHLSWYQFKPAGSPLFRVQLLWYVSTWHHNLPCALMSLLQSSLLAAVAGGLLSAINDDHDSFDNSHESLRSFLYIASFGAIIFNISATMTSLVLIERLCGLQWTAAGDPSLPKSGRLMNFDGVDLLSRFGVRKLWRYFIWHCEQKVISCLIQS